MDLLIRRIFGAKSEKLDPNQLQLLLGMEVESREPEASPPPEAGEAVKLHKTPKPRRPRLPEDLPVEERMLIPPEAPQTERLDAAAGAAAVR